jgi:FixJ family two-component response regulator
VTTHPTRYVAVVDDEAPVRTALSRLLRLENYEVIAFPSGEAFLASLDQRLPDCVILDVHVPGLSGFDVQGRLKATHADVPVVFITASDDLAARDRGSAPVLRKPFSKDELFAAVGAALRDQPRDAS